MKTSILYAALLFSPAVFAQEANLRSNQQLSVATSVKSNEQQMNANGSVSSGATIEAGQTAVQATKKTVVQTKASTETRIRQEQAAVQARTENVVVNTNKRVAKTKISADIESANSISAGKNRPVQMAASADNAARVSARGLKVSGAGATDAGVKTGRINAATNSSVRSAAVIKPRPVKASRIATTNSTLLKIK